MEATLKSLHVAKQLQAMEAAWHGQRELSSPRETRRSWYQKTGTHIGNKGSCEKNPKKQQDGRAFLDISFEINEAESRSLS